MICIFIFLFIPFIHFVLIWFHFWSFLQLIISIYKGLTLENIHDYWIMQRGKEAVHSNSLPNCY